MKTIQNLALLFLAVSLVSCNQEYIRPSGQIITDEFNVSNFDAVIVEDAFDVSISLGTDEGVIINADANVMPYVEVYTSGENLIIGLRDNISTWGNVKLEAVVSAISIGNFSASGASVIEVLQTIDHPKVGIELSGASHFNGTISTEELNVQLSGASVLDIDGGSDLFYVHASGASIVKNYGMTTSYLHADLSGASLAYVTVTDEIDIIATGGSTLNYKGNAVTDQLSLSGGSNLIHRD